MAEISNMDRMGALDIWKAGLGIISKEQLPTREELGASFVVAVADVLGEENREVAEAIVDKSAEVARWFVQSRSND